MRFYETGDINFYINVRDGWEEYCRYPPNKSWATKNSLQQPYKVWTVYTDLEGSRLQRIRAKDLHFNCWHESRINPYACLPIFYSNGSRYIKLVQDKPVGFRCAHRPVNLKELREINKKNQQEKLRKKLEMKIDKMIQKECRDMIEKRTGIKQKAPRKIKDPCA